jgi:protein TonB
MSVGGGVSAPVVVRSVEPEFTQEARVANFQGSVTIQLIVDAQGNPQNVHVVRHLGMGLDEKAIEAVRQYRFKPAMYEGRPVAVQLVIEVEFHLH